MLGAFVSSVHVTRLWGNCILPYTSKKKAKGSVWYTHTPVGHNTLNGTISRICRAAGISGFKTNHSLRVTTATRLFQSGVDEQLIMARTGHRSIEYWRHPSVQASWRRVKTSTLWHFECCHQWWTTTLEEATSWRGYRVRHITARNTLIC